ncbi:MAG: hypothetical protein RLZZ341_1619, partial [Pseudomonadota bacterium]
LGIVGEYNKLDVREKLQIVEWTMEAARGRLPAPSSDEEAMLELTAAPREPGSRLSCQVVLDAALDGLVVRLPARQY